MTKFVQTSLKVRVSGNLACSPLSPRSMSTFYWWNFKTKVRMPNQVLWSYAHLHSTSLNFYFFYCCYPNTYAIILSPCIALTSNSWCSLLCRSATKQQIQPHLTYPSDPSIHDVGAFFKTKEILPLEGLSFKKGSGFPQLNSIMFP
jgi:hypothetical protein